MSFTWNAALARWRRAPGLTALRLVALTLAFLLAAAVPVFVDGAMERVLQQELARQGAPAALLAWTAPDDGDYQAQLQALSQNLASLGEVLYLPSTGPRAVQRLQGGRPDGARKYYKLGVLPQGLSVTAGRLPESGRAEVMLPQALFSRLGWALGDSVRVTLDAGTRVDLTIVGAFAIPSDSRLVHLSGTLDNAMLTTAELWASLGAAPGEATWAVLLSASQLHAAGVADLANRLAGLPLRATRVMDGAEVIDSPLGWMQSFAAHMAATRRFLLVLLTPVYLLVLFFAGATAGAVTEGRRVEIAVLRSRGAGPGQVVCFYLPESMALLGAAVLLGLLATVPTVRLMGLSAGFLQLVGRPPLPIALGWQAWAYGLAAALLAELVSLASLARALGQTVVTIRQEAPVQSAVFRVLRVVLELALAGLTVYGTWRMRSGAAASSDPSLWALPPLFLLAAGALCLRLFVLLFRLADRLLRRFLPPAPYLALSMLRNPSARHQILALMLVLTAGLGLYGAAFARTLDRDLVARSVYGLGTDVVLRTLWESEVLEVDADGQPTAMAYHEPPYGEVQHLQGVEATARVQTRKQVALSAGTRSLGKADLVGLEPREFGQTARFFADLTPDSAAYLKALATDEQAVLASADLARRVGLKPGDRLTLKQDGSEATVVVAGTVAYWPGRLPEQGEFLVGNLPYVQDRLGLAPYDVWLRMAPGADLKVTVGALQERGGRLTSLNDSRSQVAAGRREPFRLGIYATLSTGFAVAVVVMALTYLLSAGLTMQSRAKELGILRAMGMGARSVAASLYTEQLAVALGGGAAGLGAGALAAALYVPALRAQPGETLLPVRIQGPASDRLSLVLTLILLLLTGAAIISVQMRRLNTTATLRLGEDT